MNQPTERICLSILSLLVPGTGPRRYHCGGKIVILLPLCTGDAFGMTLSFILWSFSVNNVRAQITILNVEVGTSNS